MPRNDEGLSWDLDIEGADKALSQLKEVEKTLNSIASSTDKEVEQHKKATQKQKEQNKNLIKEAGLKEEINESTGDIEKSTEKTGAGMADFGKKVKSATLQIAGMVGVGLSLMWLISSMVEQFDNLRKQVGYSISSAYQLGLTFGGVLMTSKGLVRNTELLRREINQLQQDVEDYGLFGDVGQAISFFNGVTQAIGALGDEQVEGLENLSEAIAGIRKTTALYGIDAGEALTQTISLINQFNLGLEEMGATWREEGINTVREFYLSSKKYVEGTGIAFKEFIQTIIQSGPELLAWGWRLEDIMADVGYIIKAMPDLIETVGLESAVKMMKSFRDLSLGMKVYLARFAGITGGVFEVAAKFETLNLEKQLITQTKALLGLPNVKEMMNAMLAGDEVQRRALELYLEQLPPGLQPSDVHSFTEMLPTLIKVIEGGEEITEKEIGTLEDIMSTIKEQNKYSEKMLQFQKPLISIIKDYIGGWLREGVKYIFALYHVISTFLTNPTYFMEKGLLGMGDILEQGLKNFSGILLGIMPEAYPAYPEISGKEWRDLISIPEEDFNKAVKGFAEDLKWSEQELADFTKAILIARKDFQEALEIKVPTGIEEVKKLGVLDYAKEAAFAGPSLLWGTRWDKRLEDYFMSLIPESIPDWFSEFKKGLSDFFKDLVPSTTDTIDEWERKRMEVKEESEQKQPLLPSPKEEIKKIKEEKVIEKELKLIYPELKLTLPPEEPIKEIEKVKEPEKEFKILYPEQKLILPSEKESKILYPGQKLILPSEEPLKEEKVWYQKLLDWFIGTPTFAGTREERELGANLQFSTELEEWGRLNREQKAAFGRLDEILTNVENVWHVKLPKDLIYAMSLHETAGWKEWESFKGAKGMMHVMPKTFDWMERVLEKYLGVKWTWEEMLEDPFKQLAIGTYILGRKTFKLGGDLENAVKAYNIGLTGQRKALEGSTRQIEWGEDYWKKVTEKRTDIGTRAPGLIEKGAIPTMPTPEKTSIKVEQNITIQIARVEQLEIALRELQRQVLDMKNYTQRLPVEAYG